MNTPNAFLFFRVRKTVFFLALSVLAALFISIPAAFSAELKKASHVTFNFNEVDLPVITKFVSDITGKNFIFDEKVRGKITIIAPSKLSTEDAFRLFTSVLELKGFTIIPADVDAYKIIPASEAKQKGLLISTEGLPLNEGTIARLVALKHISADDALRFFQPLVSKDGHISIFGPGNILLVVDSGLNIEKIVSLTNLIDKPALSERPEIIPLKHASADAAAKTLNDGFAKKKARFTPAPAQAGETAAAIADQRLNAVILFGDTADREAMKALIAMLDVPAPETHGRINVYLLENADAAELAKVLEGMIKGVQPSQQVKVPGQPGTPVTPFEAAGSITITPDKATNSLVILASPGDYQNLSQVIRQLDKRRKQVFVEAMIVEASIDKLMELGTKWRVIARHNGEPVFIGGVGRLDASSLQSVIFGLSGLTAGGLGNFLDIPVLSVDSAGKTTSTNLNVPGFAALFSLNEFKDAVNVLSTPQILTSDNKEAEIVVGENVPFISKRERDLTTANTVLNSIERKDVGITLRITPQITEGEHVKLDIYQEISALKQEAQEVVLSVGPTTTKRSTKTSVVVQDNQTVVIGGLIQERDEENITKVPFFGDIPLLGWLFKQKSVDKKKTNLLVFLTPHIVKESDKLSRITRGKQDEFAALQNRYAPGELLVVFREGTSGEKALAIIAGQEASVITHMEQLNTYHIRLRPGQAVTDAAKEFSSLPEVLSAEPNYRMKLHTLQ